MTSLKDDQPLRTLIVEDDAASRVALQGFLEPYGEVTLARNGREAIHLFEDALKNDTPFDLVCLDILMPELDGHCVLAQVRSLEKFAGIDGLKSARVIMVTILGDSQNMMRAYQDQCDAYLVKPVHRDDLVRHLRYFNLIP